MGIVIIDFINKIVDVWLFEYDGEVDFIMNP